MFFFYDLDYDRGTYTRLMVAVQNKHDAIFKWVIDVVVPVYEPQRKQLFTCHIASSSFFFSLFHSRWAFQFELVICWSVERGN